MNKENIFEKIKDKLYQEFKLEETRLLVVRIEKKENGEKIFTSEKFNQKEYETIELKNDEVYLRKILCISSIDRVEIPLYKIRYVNIYQLAYELSIIK